MTKLNVQFAVTVVLLTATLGASALASRRMPQPLQYPLQQIRQNIAGWKGIGDHKLDARVLKSLTPTDYLSRTYRQGNSELDLFISFYEQQKAGESMHSPKHCLPGSGWEIWRHDSTAIPVDGTSIEVNKYHIQNAGVRMLMLYWYQSADRVVANEYMGKILLARDSLVSGNTAASIVRILVADVPGAEQKVTLFASEIMGEMRRCFGQKKPATLSRGAQNLILPRL